MRTKRVSVVDIIIVLFVCLVAIGGIIFVNSFKMGGLRAQIRVDGEIYKTVRLTEDKQVIKINDTNTIIIEGKNVRMSSATCPDGDCVKQGRICDEGETIVCLPNKVVVEILGSEEVEDAAW